MGIRRSRLNPFNPAGFLAHAPGAGADVRIRALSRFAASQFLSVKDIGICASELSPKRLLFRASRLAVLKTSTRSRFEIMRRTSEHSLDSESPADISAAPKVSAENV
jgi:hypothetical protein